MLKYSIKNKDSFIIESNEMFGSNIFEIKSERINSHLIRSDRILVDHFPPTSSNIIISYSKLTIFKEEKLSGYEDVTSKVKSYFKKIIFKATDPKNTNLIPTGFLYGTLNDDGIYVEKPLHAEVAHETFWNDVSEKSKYYDVQPAYCLDMLEEKRLDFFSSVIYNEYDMVYGNDQRFQKLN